MTPSSDDRLELGVRQWRISRRVVDLNYTVSGGGYLQRSAELLITTLPPSVVPHNESIRVV
jgi:DNA adenine methylase